MDLHRDALLVGAAAVAGAVNSIAGGGTLISFPAAMAWGLPSTVANATNAVALMPGSLAAAWAYRRELRTNIGLLRLLAGPAIAGGMLGAVLLHATPVKVFDALVPWLVLGATLLILFQRRVAKPGPTASVTPEVARRRSLAAAGAQFVVGVYGGFFGAAMGIITLAFLGLVVAGDIQSRNALKNLLSALVNGVASLYFVWTHLVSWRAAALMMTAAVFGGYAGGLFARRTPARVVRALVVAIGLTLSALLAYRAWKA